MTEVYQRLAKYTMRPKQIDKRFLWDLNIKINIKKFRMK